MSSSYWQNLCIKQRSWKQPNSNFKKLNLTHKYVQTPTKSTELSSMGSPRNVTYNQNSDTTNSQQAQGQTRKTYKKQIAHLSCVAKTTPEFQQVPAKQQQGPERKTPRIC